MNLQEIIASRYADFISIQDLAACIAKKYQCTETEAVHVITDALARAEEMPDFFKEGKLGPEMLDNFDNSQVFKRLTNQFWDLEKELLDDIPF